jgi:hypothetical protein
MDRIVTPLMALGALIGVVMVGCSLEVALARHWSTMRGLPGIDLAAPPPSSIGTQQSSLNYFQLLTCNGLDPNEPTSNLSPRTFVSIPNPATALMNVEAVPSADDATDGLQTHKIDVTPTGDATPTLRGNGHDSTRARDSSDKLFGMSDRTHIVMQLPRAPSPLAHTQARAKDRSRSPRGRIALASRNMPLDLEESSA